MGVSSEKNIYIYHSIKCFSISKPLCIYLAVVGLFNLIKGKDRHSVLSTPTEHLDVSVHRKFMWMRSYRNLIMLLGLVFDYHIDGRVSKDLLQE